MALARSALCVLVAIWVAQAAARDGLHPQDGPHADVEIEILDSAVRFDVFMNLVMVDEMGNFRRENPSDVHPVEEEVLREGLLEYFASEHRVAVDGVEVAPILTHFRVVRGEPSNVVLFPMTGLRGLNKVHLVLEYPIKGTFRSVAMRWGAYPGDLTAEPDDQGRRPPIRLEARLWAEGSMRIVTFTRDEPEFVYHTLGLRAEDRFSEVPDLRADEASGPEIPLLSAGLLALQGGALVGVFTFGAGRRVRLLSLAALVLTLPGAWALRGEALLPVGSGRARGAISEADARAVFAPLHANIYRAFDYRTESDVYDALARSVTGELLDSLYNQVYRSLIMVEEGGAVSRVQDVRLEEASVEAAGAIESGERGFTVLARWQVDGVVNHFGHSHWRTNEYLARFTVVERGEGWRISSHQPLEQHRLDTDPFVDPTRPAEADEAPAPPVGEL